MTGKKRGKPDRTRRRTVAHTSTIQDPSLSSVYEPMLMKLVGQEGTRLGLIVGLPGRV